MRTQSKLLWTLRGDICGSGRRCVAPQVLGNGNFSNRAFEVDATLNALFDSCRTSTPTPTPPPALPDPVIYPTLRHPHPFSLYTEPPSPSLFFPYRLGSAPTTPLPSPFFFFSRTTPKLRRAIPHESCSQSVNRSPGLATRTPRSWHGQEPCSWHNYWHTVRLCDRHRESGWGFARGDRGDGSSSATAVFGLWARGVEGVCGR